jgi:hypothetical protein
MNKYAARRARNAEVEAPDAPEIEDFDLILSTGPGGHKVYAAKLTGSHPTFRFVREFLPQDDSVGGKRDSGVKFCGDGYYEVQSHRGVRTYLKVTDGKSATVELAEIESTFPSTPAPSVARVAEVVDEDVQQFVESQTAAYLSESARESR